MPLKMGGKIASALKAKAAPKVGGGLTVGGGGGISTPKPMPSPAAPRAKVRPAGGMRRSPTKVGGY